MRLEGLLLREVAAHTAGSKQGGSRAHGVLGSGGAEKLETHCVRPPLTSSRAAAIMGNRLSRGSHSLYRRTPADGGIPCQYRGISAGGGRRPVVLRGSVIRFGMAHYPYVLALYGSRRGLPTRNGASVPAANGSISRPSPPPKTSGAPLSGLEGRGQVCSACPCGSRLAWVVTLPFLTRGLPHGGLWAMRGVC